MEQRIRPWPALWALCLGFFMILVDSTIVSVATPAIMEGLHADINAVVWVTSAYLLAYAVPLLVTGRLGDRFGPKNLYLVGLVVFTLSSAWCGFAGGITMLIVARVVQGLGAALMTPQTMSVITRIFPPDKRGAAMGMWGAVAGVAMLVGPLLGGVLVDSLGWEWIFFINVPVGVVGFALAMALVPKLPTHSHSFDILGVVLSAGGMFCLVFGIQEGQTYDWGTIKGILSVPLLIVVGVVLFVAFVIWQGVNKKEPLVPLSLFRDRNFSLANISISTMGFAVTSMVLPLMLFTQMVRGYSPTQSALLMVPMAVLSGALAPVVGKLVDRTHPRYIAAPGLLLLVITLVWLQQVMTPHTAVWKLLLPMAVMGVAMACIWSPLSATATRNLAMNVAGAGSGVYNATRQLGGVIGSAAIAAMMESRLSANGIPSTGGAEAGAGSLPSFLWDGFSHAMGQSMLLPAAALVIGVIAAALFERPSHAGMVKTDAQAASESEPAGV
ncbi:DHA2 family efflux MFS transporter permease subunit [Rhodococcus sp. D2-41]|uniref:DHA2 family efflux MFS transporter permease subunit n=1 Tax=Speluncibacter jeojiensis TaxID=2710754 RepID=A0A9X4LZP6_9ACTN|nr:DHA2 family efflux MFS transporter permease subunit [Rhodococcus sp. D2-41]MDG3012538.1 DHA2 family efflux MFS transporter permease subunit [Rhodococcus sp. D2-41]MDG3015345.1 DHA2 family efflux MFS transporter permease subunit [Corynebacteriales bacterium D3-21]